MLSPLPLLHRYLGDRRYRYALPRAVTLQILHPSNASSLVQHVPGSLWGHKSKAVTEMIHIAYSDRDLRSVIRFAHEDVKCVDSLGDRYHCLDPGLFHFQHATYVDALFTAIELFIRPLDGDEQNRLYDECRRRYGRYGISDREVPAGYGEFREYFEEYCASRLRLSPDGEALRAQALRPTVWSPSRVPTGAIRAMLHPRARELFGIETSDADRRMLAVFAATVKARSALVPRRARYVAAAR